jgi:membrane-associated phospholipid phosphatase
MSIRTQSSSAVVPRRRWLLLALWMGELLALKWAGANVKHARQHGALVWEKDLRQQLEQRGRPMRSQMRALSQVNKVLLPTNLLLWLVFRTARRRESANFLGLAVGGVAALRYVTKLWVNRRRPAVWEKLSPRETPSFPSGHAADTMALFLALICLSGRTPWRRPLVLLGSPTVFMVGVSRIVLEKHYPTDILAGWLTASVWVLISWATCRQRPAS